MDNKTKIKAKELYGYYMGTSRSDFETYEEYVQEKKDLIEELKALGVEDVCDAEELLYSENQRQFIEDARNQGLEVEFDYSGRGMYGETCPSVCLERGENMKTMSNYETDSMGLGSVAYARR